jgi:FKBP-type peptidyl-prolyl cis-trans isomerase FklB
MKKLLISFSVLSLMQLHATAQDKKSSAKPKQAAPTSKVVLKNSADSFSYAVGINIAENMKNQGITDLNLSMMAMAFDDVFKNNSRLLNTEDVGMTLQKKLQEFAQKKNAAQRAEGEMFCMENKKKPGVTTLPSGLQYEVITPGEPEGMKPRAIDTVVVDYVGTLIDGKEFDNSFKRGEPATFPLGGVIKGWTEILQLMTKGAHWKVTIPSDLGYGERGAGGQIPPNATLIFEITLRDIKPANQ